MRRLAVLALLVAGCGDASETETVDLDAATCPVTTPATPGHLPSSDHAPTPPDGGAVWFGSDDLWTVLPTDGDYPPRLSVWWSVHFDPAAEPQPDIEVVYRRLDAVGTQENPAPGTNAYTVEDGDFMINGGDPTQPGCWEVTASYRDATLRYVYERREG